MDANLNIYISDLRKILGGSEEDKLARAMLSDTVLTIDEAIDCYQDHEIREWLQEHADYYGYAKIEE